MRQYIVTKEFPLPRIQTGAVLGNSYLGVLVWGGGDTLDVSFGCSALWDHRGGMEWSPKQNLRDIHTALLRKDAAAIKEMFRADTEDVPGQPRRPSLIPVGRAVLRLKPGRTLRRFELRVNDGLLTVFCAGAEGKEETFEFRLDMERKGELVCRGEVDSFEIKDSWTLSNGALESVSIPAPERIARPDGEGFVNALPADEGFGLFCSRKGKELSFRFARNADMEALKKEFLASAPLDWENLEKENTRWWGAYWNSVPETRIDNPALEELYFYGLYKFGAMTDPSGWPAGLQGPWLEDDGFPPWSGDYHFNINVEMCYWPAFRANRPENLRPIFKMLTDWLPRLRRNAKYFVGIDDGIMLPHAVDDRGTCRGGFWAGCIDHACAAWMVQMMYDYCDYFSDEKYLREVVFDFMKGVMRVFQEMLVRKEDGTLELPVSISPEYRGSAMNAWGANSSFQLAAIRRLAENLIAAAGILGEKCDPFWQEVLEKLPAACICGDKEPEADSHVVWQEGGPEIGLWQGVVLEESHRHHSHLAGICPFDTIDLEDPAWAEIIANTRRRWIDRGMGQWSGWSMPWASMLHSRLDGPESAELMLEIFKHTFTNEGGGTLHDSTYKGFTLMGEWGRKEIMQMDGAMGSVAAIQDMFVQSRRGVLHVGAGVPKRWHDASVRAMPAPGGFRVSCRFDRGKCSELEIAATRDNTLLLKLPTPEKAWRLPDKAELLPNGKIKFFLKKGETLTLKSC